MTHIVTGSHSIDGGPWEADTLCGRSVPEGPAVSLEDVRDDLCDECADIYGEP